MATKTIQIRGHGQITIPKRIRELFNLEDGDVLVIEEREDGILMKPRKLLDPTSVCGCESILVSNLQNKGEYFCPMIKPTRDRTSSATRLRWASRHR